MALNLKYIVSIFGLLKLASIVLGVIAYGNGMNAYVNSEYNNNCFDGIMKTESSTTTRTPLRDVIELDTTTESPEPKDVLPILWMEKFFLYVTGTCVLWSIVHLVVHLISKDVCEGSINRGIDFAFHFGGTIFLILSAIFMAFTTLKIDSLSEELCADPDNCQLMKEKLIAAGFALLTALVFFAISIKSVGKKLYETV